MLSIKNDFREFCASFAYLDIKELIENFAVFGGYDKESIKLDYDVFENIKQNIISNYHSLKKEFYTSQDKNMLLQKIATGDRKQYAIYRSSSKITQTKGRILQKELYKQHIIEKESTRESSPKKEKNRYLKKELRGYTPEDKLRFVKNFDRFWYTFIYPFSKELDSNIQKNCLIHIEQNFDKFVSLTFEELSNVLIKEDVFKLNIIQSGGYWDRYTEYDLLAKKSNNRYILGECKWTNQKICKNELRKLKNKAKYLQFDVEQYALFSKNGFSKSLKSEKGILLFELKDFEYLRRSINV